MKKLVLMTSFVMFSCMVQAESNVEQENVGVDVCEDVIAAVDADNKQFNGLYISAGIGCKHLGHTAKLDEVKYVDKLDGSAIKDDADIFVLKAAGARVNDGDAIADVNRTAALTDIQNQLKKSYLKLAKADCSEFVAADLANFFAYAQVDENEYGSFYINAAGNGEYAIIADSDAEINVDEKKSNVSGVIALGFGKRICQRGYVGLETLCDFSKDLKTTKYEDVGLKIKSSGTIPSIALRVGFIIPKFNMLTYVKAGLSMSKTSYNEHHMSSTDFMCGLGFEKGIKQNLSIRLDGEIILKKDLNTSIKSKGRSYSHLDGDLLGKTGAQGVGQAGADSVTIRDINKAFLPTDRNFKLKRKAGYNIRLMATYHVS